ncbi:ATPase family AAA domain-containing 2 [Chlorella sorokiniana]|uniref:ATPase family AAA domain-containing 2 n=1 Tax=Chlorella sorokiniana TaxID=3076 RepID=A0A2P6TKV0_CHLSO|nr:ATPase family AAA domain-containing 2 [Chlorella sorokiniana]|eukprot:PRW44913.1 ATPase family AAA domain-containing 2 [Chlorella sorokiniana]
MAAQAQPCTLTNLLDQAKAGVADLQNANASLAHQLKQEQAAAADLRKQLEEQRSLRKAAERKAADLQEKLKLEQEATADLQKQLKQAADQLAQQQQSAAAELQRKRAELQEQLEQERTKRQAAERRPDAAAGQGSTRRCQPAAGAACGQRNCGQAVSSSVASGLQVSGVSSRGQQAADLLQRGWPETSTMHAAAGCLELGSGRPPRRLSLPVLHPGESAQQWLNRLAKESVTALLKDSALEVFRKPVCPTRVPDYAKFVSRPMCLERIAEKTSGGQYARPQDVLADLWLIVSNAWCYNAVKDGGLLSSGIVRGAAGILEDRLTNSRSWFSRAADEWNAINSQQTIDAAVRGGATGRVE